MTVAETFSILGQAAAIVLVPLAIIAVGTWIVRRFLVGLERM